MKIFGATILLLLNSAFLYSQYQTKDDFIKSEMEYLLKDIKEDLYKEVGVKKRTIYSCKSLVLSDSCDISRVIHFNDFGHISSDTSFVNNNTIVTNRVFKQDKIIITRDSPYHNITRFKDQKVVDTLILNSLKLPEKLYQNGTLIKKWLYDADNRIIEIVENPDQVEHTKIKTYHYNGDTILITDFRRSGNKFDSTFKYIIFDELDRIIFNVDSTIEITYWSKGREVYFDSVRYYEPLHEKLRIEYQYTDSLKYNVINYFNNRKTYEIEGTLNEELKTTKIKTIRNNNVVGETYYDYNDKKLTRLTFQKGEHIISEISDMENDTLIIKRTYIDHLNNSKDVESYNPSGFIIMKTKTIKDKLIDVRFCVDEN